MKERKRVQEEGSVELRRGSCRVGQVRGVK